MVGEMITLSTGCNYKPGVEMGNALRMESGSSAVERVFGCC